MAAPAPDLFKGLVVCPSQLNGNQRQQLSTVIEAGGGTCTYTLSLECTHLVLHFREGEKYNFASDHADRIKIVTMPWVFACVDAGKLVDEKLFQPSMPYDAQPVQGMASMIISVTGFEGAERRQIIDTIFQCGAQYTGAMTPKNTHLIFKQPSGDKYKRAKQWGIKCVQLPWLEDSVRNGRVMSEDPYTASRNSENNFIASNILSPTPNTGSSDYQANTPVHSASSASASAHGSPAPADPAQHTVSFAPQPAPATPQGALADPAQFEHAMESLRSAMSTFQALNNDVQRLQDEVRDLRTESQQRTRDPEALAAELRQVRAKVELVKASCDQLEKDRSNDASLAAEITAVRNLVIEYSQKVQSAPSASQEMSQNDVSLTLNTSGMRDEVEALCDRVETNWKAESSAMKSQLESLSAEVSTLAVQVKASQVQRDGELRVTDVASNVESLTGRLDTLSAQQSEDITSVQDSIDAIKSDVDSLSKGTSEIANLQSKVDSVAKESQAMASQVKSGQDDTSSLTSRVTTIEDDVKTLTAKIEDIVRHEAQSEKDEQVSSASVDRVASQVTTVESSVSDLRSSQQQTSSHLTDTRAEVRTLHQRVDETDELVKEMSAMVEAQGNRWGAKVESLVAQIEDGLNTSGAVDDASARIDSLAKSLQDLTSNLVSECTRAQGRERALEQQVATLQHKFESVSQLSTRVTELEERLGNLSANTTASSSAIGTSDLASLRSTLQASVDSLQTRVNSFQARVGRLDDEVAGYGKRANWTDTKVVWGFTLTALGVVATIAFGVSKLKVNNA